MKKIENKLFLVFVALIIVFISSICISCNKKNVLNIVPTDRFSEETVFNDANLLQSYVYNAYNGLRAFTYPCIGGYDGLTDIMLWNRNSISFMGNAYYGFPNYVEGNITPDNVGDMADWSGYYANIAKVNDYFENIKNSTIDTSQLKSMNGEMRFIRAWIYFDLIRLYGGVPLITHTFSIADTSALKVGRSTYDEVANFVVSESNLAIKELANTPIVMGKINATAAKALKARMLLYMASPLNNPGNDIAKWTAAETATMDVLNSGKSLAVDYTKIPFKTSYQSGEIILARTYTFTTRIGYALNWYLWPGGAFGSQIIIPTQKFAEMFEMNDGKKITDPASGYDPQNFGANRDPRFNKNIMYPGSGPFNFKYDDGTQETRYQESYESITDPDGVKWNTEPLVNPNFTTRGGGVGHFGYTTGYNFGKDGFTYFDHVFSWPGKDALTRYQCLKYMDFNNVRFSQTDDVTEIQLLFRITEFYLNMAEIKIALGDEAGAKVYLNQIRSRAGMPNLISSGNQLVDDYRNERAIELNMEDHRFFDILRWKIAPETIGQQVEGIVGSLMDWSVLTHQLTEPGGAFGKLSFTFGPIAGQYTRKWDDKFYLLPIPSSEINRSGGKLIQNPGY